MFEQTNTNVFYLGQTYTNIVMANTSDCLATLNYFSPYWIPNVVKDMNVSMQMVLNVKHNFILPHWTLSLVMTVKSCVRH